MTISELQIQLDLDKGNKISILEKHASKTHFGYFFVDSNDGQCYLFDKNGKLDDIDHIIALYEGYVKTDIKKIVIPHRIITIGNWAFYNCSSLTSIKIPDSVKTIGHRAFDCCTSLANVEIPENVDIIGAWAFDCCTSLTSIKIPDSVKSIENAAFWNCDSLKSILFKGKTISQVKEMDDYPWGIEDLSAIKCC